MTTFYEDDNDASLDWDEERLAFYCDGGEGDLPPTAPIERYYITPPVDREHLFAVRDRLYGDAAVGYFSTWASAEGYRRERERGHGHMIALHGLVKWLEP